MPLNNLYIQGTDAHLFLLVKQDDVKAFETLYRRHWPQLVNAAYKRLDSKEKAEDIVQSIFIDVYQRRATIDVTVSLRAYLTQALKYKILNEYRADHISTKYLRHLFLNAYCKTDLAADLEAKQLGEKISGIMNDLPEKCRRVFLLSRQENLSNKEIAEKLDITVSTVEKHITKALKTLKSQLE